MKWISLHIFYTSDNIVLLKECSALIRDMQNKQYIESYFYILYKERGNHIRLRLKSSYDTIFIYNYISEKLTNFFILNPSPIDENRDKNYYPNDSIQLIAYEPEYSRYGGIHGIEISERQFQNSTDAILFYINQNKLNKYNDLLNVAFKLHLSSAFIHCENNIEKAILFFQFIFSNTSGSFHLSYIKYNSAAESTYSNYYNQQKHVLIPYVKAIWNSFNENKIIDENIEHWKNSEKEIRNLLVKAYEEKQLEIPFLFENFPTWSILQSYIHMTNNRMGITTYDEPLIAYLLMRSLKEI